MQTALSEVTKCPVTLLDDVKMKEKHDFILINRPDEEKEYYMDIIPTIRPGYDCHLHLVGKAFTQSFIPLLSPPHLTIPIDIPYIIPNTEIDKQNEEATTQTNPIKINFRCIFLFH